MGEAMELGKLMAAGCFVPPHLRGRPGDCLAVVMQSARWGMDPFAVGNKTYFVNDRMAYEGQLVNAVVNSSGRLEGRLKIEWEGEGNELVCTVTGTLKGDPEPNAPAVLYWFKLTRSADGVTFTPHLIDDDSGVGCQFPVGDLNGDGQPDLAIVNKKGVFAFTQKRP